MHWSLGVAIFHEHSYGLSKFEGINRPLTEIYFTGQKGTVNYTTAQPQDN